MSRRRPPVLSPRLLELLSDEQAAQSAHDPTLREILVRDQLMRLPARERDVLLARFYEQLTYRELAQRFGWPSKGSAHWRVRHALQHLHRKLARSRRRVA